MVIIFLKVTPIDTTILLKHKIGPKQSYLQHNNAITNAHIRLQIQQSLESNSELTLKYGVNIKTIRKHRARYFTEDKSSRPHKINYSLSAMDKEIIRIVASLN